MMMKTGALTHTHAREGNRFEIPFAQLFARLIYSLSRVIQINFANSHRISIIADAPRTGLFIAEQLFVII